jgi:catechol 2,3-dioxygenase-like lactoylglutathione lyase family enzyme
MDTQTAASTGPLAVERNVHTIHAARNIEATRALYMNILGGLIFAEGYHQGEDRDMALLYVADYMVEIMSPRDPERKDKTFARYVQRFGEGFHSFELKIADARAAAARVKAQGGQVSTEAESFFFVKPASTGGVVLEVCGIKFANDPYDRSSWSPGWAEGLPSTLHRLDHVACVIRDAETAKTFFTTSFDGEVLLDERVTSPQAGRRIVIRLGATRVAFTQPDDPLSGPLAAYMDAPNSGVYALVWTVDDIAKAEAHLTSKNVRLTREACVSSGFAIDPADFLGARHEFVLAGDGLSARC